MDTELNEFGHIEEIKKPKRKYGTMIAITILLIIMLSGWVYYYGDPIFKPFGTSTAFKDSTDYVTLNKSMYVLDSFKISKDLYVGVKGGKIYLDTNRRGSIEYSGNSLYFKSSKSEGNIVFDNTLSSTNSGISFFLSEGTPSFTIYKYRNGQTTTALTYDTLNGLYVQKGDIYVGSSAQIKLPSDTVSDYDANDAVTLNRQSGRVTTKSLTTAALGDYNLTLTNSLITANSIIICMPTTGSLSAGTVLIRAAVPASGYATIVIYNAHASDAFNGTVGFSYVIFN